MTYMHGGVEYLDADELQVYHAIQYLNSRNRTTNNSQIATRAALSRTTVSRLTGQLKRRGWIRDVSKGAAYHWRTTAKRLPDPPVPDGTPGPAALTRMFPLGRAT